MLMVIFGAGASYDSVPSRPPKTFPGIEYRPPLADELFADRNLFTEAMARFPKCQPIIPLLRRVGISVEQELEKLRSEAEEYLEGHRQLAAVRYYLHFVLWECETSWNRDVAKGITNYKSLLDQIERWRKKDDCVCLVTFNYDRMLEQALPTVGMEIKELSDYIASDKYKVIKPHGSVDWGREVETPITVQDRNAWQIAFELIDRAPELAISQRYQRVTQHPIGLHGHSALFPALAIPVEKKAEYECPAEHLEALGNFIPRATKLLVVGWRGTEFRFLELLAKSLPLKVQIMIVSGSRNGATDVSKRLHDALIRTQVQLATYDQGFTPFVENRAADGFLRA